MRSFADVLQDLNDVHERLLACQRARYEQSMKELHQQTEVLASRLSRVNRPIASLDQGTQTGPEENQVGAEAGSNTQCTTSPGLAAGADLCATFDAPPLAVSPAAWTEEPTVGTSRVAAPLGADLKVAHALPGVGAGNKPHADLRWLWEVVGGDTGGGIFVRHGESTSSALFDARLSTGALVEQIALSGKRMHFKRLTGAGPKRGWISITTSQGQPLAVRADRPPLKPRQPAPTVVGPFRQEPRPIAILFQEMPYEQGVLDSCLNLRGVRQMLRTATRVFGGVDLLSNNLAAEFPLGLYLMNFIAGMASLEKIKAQQSDIVTRAAAMSGTGVGQYTSLCAAGVFSFEDGLKLVKERMELLYSDESFTGDLPHRTIAVGRLEEQQLRALCLRACRKEVKAEVCQITAYVARRRFWVGGTRKVVSCVEEMVKERGALVLSVSSHAPHSPAMGLAQAKLSAALDEALPRMRPPLHTVWMNTTAEPVRPGCDPADIVAELKRELMSPMLGLQCHDAMHEEGISEAYHAHPKTKQYMPIKLKSADD